MYKYKEYFKAKKSVKIGGKKPSIFLSVVKYEGHAFLDTDCYM